MKIDTDALCGLIRNQGLKPDENGNIHLTKEMLDLVQELTDEEMKDAQVKYSWERSFRHLMVEWMHRYKLAGINVKADGTLTYVDGLL
jgi:hypothetical protein